MASLPRYCIIQDNSTFHVTWQCHNKEFLLKPHWVKQLYYDFLLKYKDQYGVSIYSYCFMSNHVHLSGHCDDVIEFSHFFKTVHSNFAKKYNKKINRRGQVIMDRFKSPQIQSERDLEMVMFYIDLNPKRACMVEHPKDYQWSSFHFYAYGKKDPLITPAPSYVQMGFSPEQRQKTYRDMVENILMNDWKEKKNFSHTCFIGNPDWVHRKNIELRRVVQAKKEAWKERFRQRFQNQNLPPPS